MEPYSLDAFQPVEPGLRAHCRRVAALVQRIAGRLEFSGSLTAALEKAALVHHYPAALLGVRERLMADLQPQMRDVGEVDAARLPGEVESILLAFHGYSSGDRDSQPFELAGRVLECCNIFDEEMENLPYEPRPANQAIKEFVSNGGPLAKIIWNSRIVDPTHLARAANRLSEFIPASRDALQWVRRQTVDTGELIDLIGSNEFIQTAIFRVANSAFFSPVRKIVRLDEAIAFLGADVTRRIVSATAVQPLFEPGNLRHLWCHSLETADWAARLAEAASGKGIDPVDAFHAGLLHDLGRVVMHRLDPEQASDYLWWTQRGCPATYAETILCGRDHGSIGAEVIRDWDFPQSIAQGIEFHHCPELSQNLMAAVLYLAEIQAGADEDLPSTVRRHHALKMLGLSEVEFENLHMGPGPMAVLAAA